MFKNDLFRFLSGFPMGFNFSTLKSVWLKEDGLSRSTIGWAGLYWAGAYAFNYLWSPLVDNYRLPI